MADTSLTLENELSPATLAALRDFEATSNGPFAEDWRMSQFWYDDVTVQKLAAETLFLSGGGRQRIACIACPSLFRELTTKHPEANVHLLEYDHRFAVFEERFTFYDYNEPLGLPESLSHAFEVIVADPPYLSKECLEKTAQTMQFLSKKSSSPLLLLTGAVQRERAWRHLQLRPCKFRPQHTRKLGNEFMLFTNFSASHVFGGWEADEEDGGRVASERM